MATETLSFKQTKEILNKYQDILNQSVNRMEKAYNDYFNIVKNEWEDKYIKNLSNEIVDKMNNTVDLISENCKLFVDKVVKIEKDNMPEIVEITFNLPKLKLNSNINEMFEDNKVGFKTLESPEKIFNAISSLQTEQDNIIAEITKNLIALNVYGNDRVIQYLIVSSGKIIELLLTSIEEIDEMTKKYVQEAAKEYTK